ncbi:MAG: nickel pincer cofactor biosynthesis protein LarC [Sulfolobales archaeon]
MDNVLVLDPTVAGVSGDMLVASLIDLGGSIKLLDEVSEAIRKLPPVKRFEVFVEDCVTGGVRAKRVRTLLDEVEGHTTGGELLKWFEAVANDLGVEGVLKEGAENVLRRILDLEALLHGSTPSEVYLHEVGSVDTIFDVLAFIMLMDELKLSDALRYSLPVAVGGGLLKSAHGMIPSPAYLTLELLRSKNYYVVGGPIDEELTTPTGAALLAEFFKPIKYLPLMRVVRVGYGSGSKEFSGIANVVRAVLGSADTGLDVFKYEEVYVLESNVDDVTGEILGYTVERLTSLGALDVSVIPTTTKKGRPGYVVKVISNVEHVQDLLVSMLRELGTLGVRVSKVGRYVVPIREFKELRIDLGREYVVRIKVCKDEKGNIIRIKPEFEDLKIIAKELNIPVRELLERLTKEL